MPRFRRLLPALKAALPVLLLAGVLREARAIALSWNADDLRGVWVMTCPVFNGATSLGEYYVQFSMGGAATNNNTVLGVLGGGTYQESSTRSITGGSFTVTGVGVVTGTLTYVDSNAGTGTINPTTANALTMGQDKNTMTGGRGTDTAYTGATIGSGARPITMTKISDEEVRDGNNAGQACFLSGARR